MQVAERRRAADAEAAVRAALDSGLAPPEVHVRVVAPALAIIVGGAGVHAAQPVAAATYVADAEQAVAAVETVLRAA